DLATARELWQPTPSDPYGDLDRPAARLALRPGRLDRAEALNTRPGSDYQALARQAQQVATTHA
ncbi:MAG: hypothetical protein ACRDTT_32120, partial [Pseudonocardiaceae bacterium]